MRIIYLKKTINDEEIGKKEGEYIDLKHYKFIINKNCDGYKNDTKELLFKFRKNVIPKKLTKLAYNCFNVASKQLHDNRGAAAGILDRTKMPRYIGEFGNRKSKFRTNFYSNKTGKLSNQLVSNRSPSNIVGYYDKPDRNIGRNAQPCRITAFIKYYSDEWEKSLPFIKKIDKLFKKLVPNRHKIQRYFSKQTKFCIGDTAYSTMTINNNWRTALHKDAGDLEEGFGNLIVCSKGKFSGGYLGFPQYSVCINVQDGDFLAMDVHEWHCNTEIKPITKEYDRLSIVAYLRKNMIRCKGLKLLDYIYNESDRYKSKKIAKKANKKIAKKANKKATKRTTKRTNKKTT